jgi:hypothetical protein
MVNFGIAKSIDNVNPRQAANAGILLLITGFVTGFVPYVASSIKIGGRDYQTGDWLINYSGGFVRRGLMGEIIILLIPSGNLGLWIVLILQSLMYFTVFAFFGYILKSSNSSWFLTSIICSPVGICFFGWDSAAFGRKEVIGYLVLILLSIRVISIKKLYFSRLLLSFSYMIFTIGVFSWEPIVMLLPFILILVNYGYLTSQGTKERFFSNSIFFITGFAGFTLSIVYKGTSVQSVLICDTVKFNGFTGSGICSGAIDAIGWPTSYARHLVEASYPESFLYIPLLALALLPIFFSSSFLIFRRFMIISFLCLLPLFYIVSDYGRIISMYYISLLIVLLAGKHRIQSESRILNTRYFGLFFLFAWGVPVSVNPDKGFPFVSPIVTVFNTYIDFSTPGKLVYLFTLVVGILGGFYVIADRAVRKKS